MTEPGRIRLTPHLVLGLGVLAIGLLFTAEKLGLADAEPLLDYWPAILIAVGATRLAGSKPADKVFALFWIGVGAWLLAWNLDYIDANPFEFFWPLVLIIVGSSLVRGALARRSSTGTEESTVGIVAIMGGVERKFAHPVFAGGDISVFMGGGKLDLREASLAEEDVVLQVFAMWGGYELRLPPDWEVSIETLPILGAVEDKRTLKERGEGRGRLVLRGTVIMGGVELKS